MGRRNCMKCGKGVGVLVCKGSSCPVVIHESCIPGSLLVSNKENFYCPYCLYRQSVAECQQAKEKALLAQRKVLTFLGTKTSGNKDLEPNNAREDRRTPQNHEHSVNQERTEEGEEGAHSLRIENDPKGSEYNLVDTRAMSSNDGSLLPTVDNKGGFIRQCKGGPKVFACTNGIKMVENQKNHHLYSKVGGRVPSFDTMRACERRTINVEYLAPMPVSVVVGGVIQQYVCQNENFTLDQQHREPFHSSKMEQGAELEPSLDNLWGKIQGPVELAEVNLIKREDEWYEEAGSFETAACSWSNGRADISEQPESGACDNPPGDEVCRCDDNNVMNSSTAGRIDNPGKKRCSPIGVASDTRRKRLRWTNEEEEILKKGVLVYSTGVKKNLPWRKILEFGRRVFDGSRTPSDLKTKWKLIARKEHLE